MSPGCFELLLSEVWTLAERKHSTPQWSHGWWLLAIPALYGAVDAAGPGQWGSHGEGGNASFDSGWWGLFHSVLWAHGQKRISNQFSKTLNSTLIEVVWLYFFLPLGPIAWPSWSRSWISLWGGADAASQRRAPSTSQLPSTPDARERDGRSSLRGAAWQIEKLQKGTAVVVDLSTFYGLLLFLFILRFQRKKELGNSCRKENQVTNMMFKPSSCSRNSRDRDATYSVEQFFTNRNPLNSKLLLQVNRTFSIGPWWEEGTVSTHYKIAFYYLDWLESSWKQYVLNHGKGKKQIIKNDAIHPFSLCVYQVSYPFFAKQTKIHPFRGVSPPLSAKALVDGAGRLDLLDVVAWLLAETADQGLVASCLPAAHRWNEVALGVGWCDPPGVWDGMLGIRESVEKI